MRRCSTEVIQSLIDDGTVAQLSADLAHARLGPGPGQGALSVLQTGGGGAS